MVKSIVLLYYCMFSHHPTILFGGFSVRNIDTQNVDVVSLEYAELYGSLHHLIETLVCPPVDFVHGNSFVNLS